ncbi:type II toxin-antitoxin system RelE/ParE family toxin [Variovorax paradoxus]|uniref:Type II toxin-antitoxin system RelE/ParE family toxin n=1 Tax=Variovorax paradoxus TaxID=34073 RepID=A0A6I6HFM0_VARPD|nr:type II toxin-antitoxin system RelE/ParE family toxin [Variovorax paradoxus]QGW82514.1 hypothetical protein GOQ09_13385 [Variovorax paradoxus]
MRVLWTLSTEQDRADIVDLIARDNPLAAIRVDEIFSAAVGRLAEHPLEGQAEKLSCLPMSCVLPGHREVPLRTLPMS